MTTSATLRLVGLLVIVGVIAGCGEKPSARSAAGATLDALLAETHGKDDPLRALAALGVPLESGTVHLSGVASDAQPDRGEAVRIALSAGGGATLDLWRDLADPSPPERSYGTWEVRGNVLLVEVIAGHMWFAYGAVWDGVQLQFIPGVLFVPGMGFQTADPLAYGEIHPHAIPLCVERPGDEGVR